MKKITLMLALIFTALSFSQVTIGTGNNGTAFNSTPIAPYYGFNYSQTIYLASEIDASGNITSLDFQLNPGTSITTADDMVDVWIGHTVKTEFASTSDWVDVTTLTQVLTGGTVTSAGDVLTITFSAPFAYNGTDNLIIAVDANESGYGGSSDYMLQTTGPANTSLYQQSDSVNTDPLAPAVGVRKATRGNITFNGITQACPSPSGMTASNVTATSAELSWTAGASETQWQLEWNADTDFTPGTGTSGGSAGPNPNPTYTAMGLTPDTTYYIYYRADCGGGETSAWVGPFIGTTLVSCGTPTALLANPSDVTAIISWTAPTAGTPTGYNWEVQPDGVSQGTAGAITGNIAGTSDTVSGLTVATPYDLFVQTDCGAVDGMSTWVGPYSFTTNSVPPPANDECSGAISLTVNTDFLCGSFTSGTNLGATASPQVDDATGTPNDDVWYSFVATSTDHRITLTNVVNVYGNGVDMVIAVYDGTTGCSSLAYQGSSDPNTYNISGLTVSNNYLVRVFGYYSGTSSAQTTFDICVGRESTDTLEYYNLQWPASGTITDGDGYNVYAKCYEAGLTDTTSGQAPGVECWIGYSASDTDPSGTGWTWVVAAFDSEQGNDDQYILDLDASVGAGTYYYASRWSQNLGPYTYGGIQADGSYGGIWGADNNISGMLTVNAPPPPANDDCANATAITIFNNGDTQNASSATNNDGFILDCGLGMNDGVWYTFNVIDAGTIEVAVTGVTGWDPELAVYSGSCGTFTCTASADSGGSGGDESVSFVATANTQYWVNIGHYSSSTDSAEGPFTIDVSTTDTATLDPSLSIDDAQFEGFNYFPNPVEGTLSLRAQDIMQNVAVYNMLGQEVINTSPNAMSNELDMSALSRGTYFVRISINGAVENFKIIKE